MFLADLVSLFNYFLYNYTGDRLNFGLAAEQAKTEGFEIETVIVGDYCALPPPLGIAGCRGLAGTILVHKVAGATAAAGLSLTEVAAEAKHAAALKSTYALSSGYTICLCASRTGYIRSFRSRENGTWAWSSWGAWCCCGRHSTCGCCSLPCSAADTESRYQLCSNYTW